MNHLLLDNGDSLSPVVNGSKILPLYALRIIKDVKMAEMWRQGIPPSSVYFSFKSAKVEKKERRISSNPRISSLGTGYPFFLEGNSLCMHFNRNKYIDYKFSYRLSLFYNLPMNDGDGSHGLVTSAALTILPHGRVMSIPCFSFPINGPGGTPNSLHRSGRSAPNYLKKTRNYKLNFNLSLNIVLACKIQGANS